MDGSKPSDKPKQLKADTRQWNSGRVKFAVIGWEGRPDDNYIVLEKNFFGRSRNPDQKFNLRSRDWVNLKKLIDGDLQMYSDWERTVPTVDQAALTVLIADHPDLFEKVLSNPNILKLSEASLPFGTFATCKVGVTLSLPPHYTHSTGGATFHLRCCQERFGAQPPLRGNFRR